MAEMKDSKMVQCAGTKYHPFVTLEECQDCGFHIMHRIEKEKENDKPPIEVIICAVPRMITVAYLVENIPDKGKERYKKLTEEPEKEENNRKEQRLGEVG